MWLSGENKHHVSTIFRFVKLIIRTMQSRCIAVFQIKFNKNKKKCFVKRICGYSIRKLMFDTPIFSIYTLVTFILLRRGSWSEKIDTF